MPSRPILIAATLLLVGCGTRPHVERDWGDAMAQLNLIGVFPVTERLQPGDVLLDVPPAAGADPQPRAHTLGSLDRAVLLAALREQDGGQLFIEGSARPASVAKPPTATAVEPPASPAKERAARQRQQSATKQPDEPPAPLPFDVLGPDSVPSARNPAPRMRRVALPGIVTARVSNVDVAGAGLIGRVAAGLGFGDSAASGMVISLKDLSMLALEGLVARRVLHDNLFPWLSSNGLTAGALLSETLAINPAPVRQICKGEAARSSNDRALVRVVGRVLYAHDITYEYTRTNTATGRLAADISQVAAGATGFSAVPSSSGTAVTQPGTTPDVTRAGPAIDAGAARLQAAQTALGAATPSGVGVRSSIGVGTYGNAALIDKYDRPMAAGFNTIVSYGVGDAMVVIGPTRAESDEQLADARAICDGVLGQATPPQQVSVVERRICANTATMIKRYGLGGRVAMPGACPTEQAGSDSPRPPTPFAPVYRVGRDNQARSF